MKDLFEWVVRLVPRYLEEVFELVARPKQFARARLTVQPPSLVPPLVFFALSLALAWILTLTLSRKEPWLELGPDAVFVLIYVVAYGGALHLAWRLVGGCAGFLPFMIVYLYYAGIVKLGATLVFLVAMGAMRAIDPILHDELLASTYRGQLAQFLAANQERVVIPMTAVLIGLAVLLIWIVVGWGAFRELHGLSRARSMAAGFLFAMLSVPVAGITVLIANALIR